MSNKQRGQIISMTWAQKSSREEVYIFLHITNVAEIIQMDDDMFCPSAHLNSIFRSTTNCPLLSNLSIPRKLLIPIYLLHGTLIKTILVWALYCLIPPPTEEIIASEDENGELVTTILMHPLPLIWKVIRVLVCMDCVVRYTYWIECCLEK